MDYRIKQLLNENEELQRQVIDIAQKLRTIEEFLEDEISDYENSETPTDGTENTIYGRCELATAILQLINPIEKGIKHEYFRGQ